MLEKLGAMKKGSLQEALDLALALRDENGKALGELVPVGPWILGQEELVKTISAWRGRHMRSFLARFESTPQRSLAYLRDFSIGQRDRLFFMIRGLNGAWLGHLGISNAKEASFELDNMLRGVDGGEPRLMFHAEACLLHWCFKVLGMQGGDLRVLSNNFIIGLHLSLGYRTLEELPLFKREEDGQLFHDVVPEEKANVGYTCLRMGLRREDFYAKAPWLEKA